jgi:hypothetical protein
MPVTKIVLHLPLSEIRRVDNSDSTGKGEIAGSNGDEGKPLLYVERG